MTEKNKRANRAQRYTTGMLDAVDKLVDLVRERGLSVLPPRAVEVIGKSSPTRALLIEAAVRVLLDEANGHAAQQPVDGRPQLYYPPNVRGAPRPADPFHGMTVMYGAPPIFPDATWSEDDYLRAGWRLERGAWVMRTEGPLGGPVGSPAELDSEHEMAISTHVLRVDLVKENADEKKDGDK